jgi:hypothetical protein
MSSKPVVRYETLVTCEVGHCAYVYPVDHPSELVSNTELVMTSAVVSFDPATGEFETRNSCYVPSKGASWPGEV